MKQIKFGDILDAQYGIIVHGCNAQGVMGSGTALHIK
jgi:O-acetyl-ADP-ribose deacetylase (regulator of RNase III)